MRSAEYKEKKSESFSYLDLVLLLLAFLLVSLGIGLFADAKSKEDAALDYTVVLEAELPEQLKDAVPRTGDSLYGDSREVIGTVLHTELTKTTGGFRLLLTARLEKKPSQEKITVETASFLRVMTVLSAEEMKGE